MAELSDDQLQHRAAIQKAAIVWGAVAGVVAGLLALWLLGALAPLLRYVLAAAAALGLGVLAYRASFRARARDAACPACGAAFSRSRSDRSETLLGSEPKETREAQDDGSTRILRWTEERYEVVDSYSCAKCGDTSTETWQRSRRADETSEVEPAPVPEGWTRTEAPADAPEPEPAAPAAGTRPGTPEAEAPAAPATPAAGAGWSSPPTPTPTPTPAPKDAKEQTAAKPRRRR
jgi:predicted RNA-binding Zn-ribbon protein involved in translation (DUF1610 family)